MTAILLRMAGLGAFNADAEPAPPDDEIAQVEQGMSRSEGNALSVWMLAAGPRFCKSLTNTMKA